MDMFGKGSGYRWMDAYLLAWIVELATDSFCAKYLDYRNDPQGKTSGQMNHAARSGCRNFAEGCERLMTSTGSGLDLLNVAKGSLGELRDDYLKWLMRDRQLPWDAADADALAVQGLDMDPPPNSAASAEAGTAGTAGSTGTAETGGPGRTGSPGNTARYTHRKFCEHLLKQYAKFARWLEHEDSHVRANALVILCTRAAKMQEAYIRRVGEDFKKEGGFKEKMGDARREVRAQQEDVQQEVPTCDLCGAPMRKNHRKKDNSPFWGCTNYPACKGTTPYQP
jgi:four helix bundle suffix protein